VNTAKPGVKSFKYTRVITSEMINDPHTYIMYIDISYRHT